MSKKREMQTMEKTRTLVLAFASSLLLSSFAIAQSPTKPEASQMRRVKHQVLTSTYLPSIRVRFDKTFKYVGSQRFILYDRAQVEQHFSVDADNQHRIKGMYMVQFEGYLPNVNATYDYPATKTINLERHTYIVNVESIPNVPTALKQNPESDVNHAASFLENKGYRISESIMFQRFVRLVDEAKRNEFIFDRVNRTVTNSLPPNQGMLITRGGDYNPNPPVAEKLIIEEIRIAGSNGEIILKGDAVQKAFVVVSKPFYRFGPPTTARMFRSFPFSLRRLVTSVMPRRKTGTC